MKKNLIVIAVFAAMVLPALASADVKVSGDARYRMHSRVIDYTGGKDVDDAANHRVRIKINAKMDDGASMHLRFSTADGTAEGGSDKIKSDYGYIKIPWGPVTIVGGRVPDSWGNRLFQWDEDYDLIGLDFKAGGWDMSAWRTTYKEGGEYTEPDNGTDPFEDTDKIGFGFSAQGKFAGSHKLGVRYETIFQEGTDTSDGDEFDIYYKGKAGPVKIMAEFASVTPTTMTTTSADTQTGLYAMGTMKFGGNMDASAAFGQTSKGFAADNHFAPFSTIGTAYDTAGADFGEGMEDLQVIAGFFGMNFGGKTRIQFALAIMTGKQLGATTEGDGTVFDFQVSHKLGKSSKLTGSYGIISMDEDFTGGGAGSGDVDYTAMGVRIDTKWK